MCIRDSRNAHHIIQPVVRTELAAHVTGTADGQQILAALQIHILFKGSHIDLSCPRQPDADLLVHGVRSRDLSLIHIFRTADMRLRNIV